MHKKSTQILFFLLFSNAIVAQRATYTYDTELCVCKGVFDSTKYSRKQLQNTYFYLMKGLYIDADAMPWDLESQYKINLQKLESECHEKMQLLKSLNYVKNAYWKKVYAGRLKEMEETCELKRVTIKAWSNPKELLALTKVDSLCIYYREALINGGSDLLAAWKFLNEQQKKNNGSPAYIQKEFEKKYHSSKQMEYARLEVMKYGWWNAANHLVSHFDNDETIEKEFEKLFLTLKRNCSEP